MKLLTNLHLPFLFLSLLVLLLLHAHLVTSESFNFGLHINQGNNKQASLQSQINDDDKLAVPGENPLTYCGDTSNDILAIDYVDLSPNPPEAGKSLTIKASGVLSEPVEKGAYVQLQVKYGLIRLINQKADLCDQVRNVDLECPLEEGETVFVKEVDLPKEIPPGKYSVNADVYTKDDRRITCLEARVEFGNK